jgi:hypothetical protein
LQGNFKHFWHYASVKQGFIAIHLVAFKSGALLSSLNPTADAHINVADTAYCIGDKEARWRASGEEAS